MKRLSLFLSFGFVLLPALALGADAPAAPKPFQPEDLKRIANLSDPQLSPDGRYVALMVSRPNWEDDKSDKEIDLVEVKTGVVRPLTYKRSGLGSMRWSPSGDRLAFIAQDPDTKEGQLYVMSMAGGDPVRLTDGKQGVDSFSWSPDGQTLAFYRQ